MSIPRTGSQGLSRDLWALCHAACYEPHPEKGHGATPPLSVLERFGQIDVPFDPADPRVPFDPKCTKCRRAGKRVMERRGLTRDQVIRCFDALGARWEWTSPETDAKRRERDTDEMVVTGPGQITLRKNVKAKERRAARKIAQRDLRPEKRGPVGPSAATLAESARINSMWD